MRRWGVALSWMVACAFVGATGVRAQESPFAGTCHGALDISYPDAPASSEVGDLVRVQIKLGAREIRGGTSLSINRVRFNLDCNGVNLGINCPDDGAVVSYQGDLTTDCGVVMSTSHNTGDTLPNQVVFTPGSPIVIPAGVASFCSLDFLVRIESLSSDATPSMIEQVGGFDASLGDGVCDTAPPLAAGRTSSSQICLGAGCETRSTSCEPLLDLSYPGAHNLLAVGETVRAHLTFGGGYNGLGAPVTIRRARFNLDCNDSNLGINCPDDGAVVSYQGHLTTTCPVAFTASHSPGDTLPNQVVFTPDAPLRIPAQTPDYCSLDFDLRLETASNDSTPNVIEQVFGMDASLGDAFCDVSGPNAGSDSNASSLELCPQCNDGNQCNGLEYCDGDTGCATGTPVVCDDYDDCTVDSCDPTVFEGDPCVFKPIDCDDHNACTDSSCVPGQGCVVSDNSARCNDGDACTSDACDPATGDCLRTPVDCDDNNACTTDTCDPASGCRHEPSSCDDGNSCTADSCLPAAGCVHVSNGTCGANPRGIGYWKRLCRGPHPSGDFLGAGDVACARAACPFTSVGSTADLCARLSADPPNDACARAEAQLLALLLNVCRGRVDDTETIRPSCGSETSVGAARARIEAQLCDPARSHAACADAACAAEEIDSGKALGVTSLRAGAASGGGVVLTWEPPYLSGDAAAPLRYRVWRRPSSESAFLQIGETQGLAYTDAAAPAAGAQYEVTVVW